MSINDSINGASQVVLVIKNPPTNAGDIRDTSSIPGSGRSPGAGHGNPLQYSCLENPRLGGAWWAAVYGVARSQTRLKQLSSSSSSSSSNMLFVKIEFKLVEVLQLYRAQYFKLESKRCQQAIHDYLCDSCC